MPSSHVTEMLRLNGYSTAAFGKYHETPPWEVSTSGPFDRWPSGIKAKGELRTQWHHVTDLGPRIMEAAGLPFSKSVNGAVQKPFEGISRIYSLNDSKAKDRHTTQYFEMFGNRAIYHDGWVAATKHRTPWADAPDGPFEKEG